MYIITPVIKNGLVLWDYTFRASQFESFLMQGDNYSWYTPVLFEKL